MQHPNEPNQIPSSIVRKMHVATIVGLSKTRIEALIRNGTFPAPFKLTDGGRASGWLRSTLDQWIATRAKAATAAHLNQQGKASK